MAEAQQLRDEELVRTVFGTVFYERVRNSSLVEIVQNLLPVCVSHANKASIVLAVLAASVLG